MPASWAATSAAACGVRPALAVTAPKVVGAVGPLTSDVDSVGETSGSGDGDGVAGVDRELVAMRLGVVAATVATVGSVEPVFATAGWAWAGVGMRAAVRATPRARGCRRRVWLLVMGSCRACG